MLGSYSERDSRDTLYLILLFYEQIAGGKVGRYDTKVGAF